MDLFQKFSKIETLIFDVDGVFTDNSLLVTETGDFLRVMSARDGLGIRLAVESGLRIAIITGGDSVGVNKRLQKLGVVDVFQKIDKKIHTFNTYIKDKNLDPDTIMYMGDDLLDLEVLSEVFLSACPRDAAPEVLKVSDYISPFNGGKGCVRDVVEKVLMAQDKWKY
jgi:3-deoxy-D-manno-octulosonate 8-phosphate phosphatase (KDO 8-P phosphatase)